MVARKSDELKVVRARSGRIGPATCRGYCGGPEGTRQPSAGRAPPLAGTVARARRAPGDDEWRPANPGACAALL